MLAHLRTEAYLVYRRHQYPPSLETEQLSYERNNRLIDEAKSNLEENLLSIKDPHQSQPDQDERDRKRK